MATVTTGRGGAGFGAGRAADGDAGPDADEEFARDVAGGSDAVWTGALAEARTGAALAGKLRRWPT